MKTITKIGEQVLDFVKSDRDYNFFSSGQETIKASRRTGKIFGKEEFVETINLIEDEDATREKLITLGISNEEISILAGDSMGAEYNSVLQKCLYDFKLDEASLVEAIGKIYDLEKSFEKASKITNLPNFSEEKASPKFDAAKEYSEFIPKDMEIVEISGGISIKDALAKKVLSIWNVREKKGVLLCTISLNQVVLDSCKAPAELEIFDFKGKFPYFNNVTKEQVKQLLQENCII